MYINYSSVAEALFPYGNNSTPHNFRAVIDRQNCFIKTNSVINLSAFEAEADLLTEIAESKTINTPQIRSIGISENCSYLMLEWLDLCALDEKSAAKLGECLALMHGVTNDYYGWYRDNTIGLSPQQNAKTANWIDFWKKYRLGFQLELAMKNGYHGRLQVLGNQLLDQLPALFSSYQPVSSLLHGDLWYGNVASLSSNQPIIFDPAGYYGDRETDLAMATLFGGFPNNFFSAYNATWPLDAGYNIRKDFYNIYHLLNHLNIFGKSYLQQVERTMELVLSNIR